MKHTSRKQAAQADKHGQRENTPEENDIDVATDPSGADVDETIDVQSEAGEISADIRDKADKYDALNERYVRLLAEYDNFRKRVAKERELLLRTATEDLMKDILPVLDNLDRATEHRNDETSLEEYTTGIALIEEQLRNVLAHAGLSAIEVVGQPFDPNLHDAIMQMETEDFESGIVAQEVQKGYTLGGRVIRHSKVIVSK